jgi:hypothetical protein
VGVASTDFWKHQPVRKLPRAANSTRKATGNQSALLAFVTEVWTPAAQEATMAEL